MSWRWQQCKEQGGFSPNKVLLCPSMMGYVTGNLGSSIGYPVNLCFSICFFIIPVHHHYCS